MFTFHARPQPTLWCAGVVFAVAVAVLVAACTVPGASSATPSASASPSAATSVILVPTPTAVPTPTPTPSPTTTASPTATPTPSPTPAATTYTVVAGDSLSLIAIRFATTWQSLVYWNRDRYPGLDPEQSAYDPNRIAAGWQLTVWPGVVVDYEPPLPTPRPTATSSATSTVVTHGGRSSGMIALTFDMGGRTEPAVAIMSWLRDHRVPATIFMTGSSVDSSNAAREVVSLINANPTLFDLGNHSYNHPHMATLTAAQVRDELRRAENAIGAYADQSPRPWFRPPFGEWDAEVLAGAAAAGYGWTVMWDVDTIDWKPIADGGPTAAQIASKVVGNAQGGSIVLMHLGGYETLEALPAIVDGLRARGFDFVTLDTLLGA